LPVLLIHGYGCNGGYWAPLRRLLAQAGISHLAIDLEPITAPIDDYAGQVGQALELLCGHGAAAQAIIVAHSMGGLVARAYLRQHGAARIARVITLGTPHHGTGLAGFGIGSNTVQMRRSGRDAGAAASAWLDSLADMENAAQRALFTSIFSHHDNIVAPQTSAYFPGAKNLEFGAVGHVALGRSARILACVMEEIALASEAANADSGKPRQRG
jgi:triacylglycerol esterase/lipase EstA (alpha/beta hydrolase family)